MWTVPELATFHVPGNVMDYGSPQLVARYTGLAGGWVTNWTYPGAPNGVWRVRLRGDGIYDAGTFANKNGLPFPYGLPVDPP